MYSLFLWWNAKGQLETIIKRRWWRRTSKRHQICSQSMELIKHVHQNLTMSRMNGHDSLQRTTNVKVIQSRWWRNSNSSTNRISRRFTGSSTCRRGRGTVPEGSTLGCLELPLIWATLCLRNVAPMGATVRDCAPDPFLWCWVKSTWMGGVVLLPLKMEVRLVIFSPLD